MKSLFEKLFQFSHDTLGTDLHSSPEANKLQDEIDAIEDKMKKLDKLMAMERIFSEEYNELFKEKNKLEREGNELKKKITQAEKDYFKAKTHATTGMGSIGGAMQDFLNGFINMGGGGPQGNPLGNAPGWGGGNGGAPSPPDMSGDWTWNPDTNSWDFNGGPGAFGPGSGDGTDPTETEQDTTDEDLLSENQTHTEILNRIDANTSGFILQPVVIG